MINKNELEKIFSRMEDCTTGSADADKLRALFDRLTELLTMEWDSDRLIGELRDLLIPSPEAP